ncbi:hypothetical protein, partial [Sphingobium sp.]|uniref:hypothetical protein n=1 Tax=Sphingobium sp. TaxID=1912891 RepID=UPI0025FD1502
LNQTQKCSGNTRAGACMSLNKNAFSKSTVQVGFDDARGNEAADRYPLPRCTNFTAFGNVSVMFL